MDKKRFEITEYGSNYYIEIIDNEKELDESIHNPSQKLGLVECVDLLNEQQATIEMYQRRVDKREEQISIIKKHCLKFLTDEQVETIRKELED